ncbi:MAG: hypothetical protein ACLFT5_06390, partial [Desulfovermiculus sp.]
MIPILNSVLVNIFFKTQPQKDSELKKRARDSFAIKPGICCQFLPLLMQTRVTRGYIFGISSLVMVKSSSFS